MGTSERKFAGRRLQTLEYIRPGPTERWARSRGVGCAILPSGCPVAEAENALNPSLKMTPKEQFIEAANMMCGYSREDLAMLSEKGLIQVIDGFLVLAEEPEKRGNPEICRWAKRLRELRVQLMEGSQ
jgi:hypothetical protein